VIVCVPSGLTQVERNAVAEAADAAGTRRARLIDEPLAAALGAGLPVGEARGSLIVDVGGGTTEMAVTALGEMVVSNSIQVGGYDLDEAIVRSLEQTQRLLVGQEQAEAVKIEIGSAVNPAASGADRSYQVAGRDLSSGMLRRSEIDAAQVHGALERPVAQIVEAVKGLLDQTPAELSADVASDGLTLAGGGSLLHGLADVLQQETGLHVSLDPEPLTTVARGAGLALDSLATIPQRHPRRRSRR
jgi:rod shape-determining protein MreB